MIAVVLAGCGSSEMPLPSIVSVEPSSLSANERVLLTVEIDGALPLFVDYGEELAGVLPLTHVLIADRKHAVLRMEDQGRRLIVEFLPGLPVGRHDVRVEFQDARQTVLEDGFEVTRALDITGFEIEPIGSQFSGKPFFITVRAVGPDAPLFQGRVKVYSNNGIVTPDMSNPFQSGLLTQEITVSNTDLARPVNIYVEDYAGHLNLSNEFQVSRSP